MVDIHTMDMCTRTLVMSTGIHKVTLIRITDTRITTMMGHTW
ncbi:MAG: hypothetical protein QM234_01135 [Acidobacteriota bacterium]|nr:hypothetical protein [Acidobacteriota bacterium]